MRKSLIIFSVLALALLFSACTRIDPGWTGVKVNLMGDERGPEEIPIEMGLVGYNPITQAIYEYPTHIVRTVWTKDPMEGSENDESITFNSMEGATMNVDVALAAKFIPDRVPYVLVEFRENAQVIMDGYVRDQVREAFNVAGSTMKAVDILGEKQAEFLNHVDKEVRDRLEPKGFEISSVSLLVKPRVDQRVEDSINAVLAARQKAIEAEQKIAQAAAEAEQKRQSAAGEADARLRRAQGEADAILKLANAQAEANQKLARSVTSQLISYEATKKWNGSMPQVTSGAVPFIQLPKN